ncbi:MULTISPECIES: hypothetical protein [unclassified Candidatus Frackibacter]|uniref:hypothetical protein n=1 Tax=unclassified Candidatus Frackibacter TaxID=2648818 RepID=UPI0008906447|nr:MULTISPECIES: hypothetical protein [unclassified Candidatus Frackibacter]SDC33499.1 hypothetical protein SAMN04515661_10719 [Candidatus Frackibacter sp. WG11]SEM57652.1 hypothetical protein SAMN04488698_10798 [Candidatus Frackibacter sp. WG12]SFM09363.1 hypothetical protein SAMN04488699_1364 [Candidatus Frackibacter sp. WG13]
MQKKFDNKSIKDYIFNWRTAFAIGLILTSGVIYIIHYAIFKDLHHILVFLVEDIAFIPIEVLIVTLIIHRLLEIRDKRRLLNKLNMVIGGFYSEVGNELITKLACLDLESDEIRSLLQVSDSWTHKEFKKIHDSLNERQYDIAVTKEELIDLKKFLSEERNFLLNLLENPNLLEHEEFTDLLWAVFHLTEELKYRKNLEKIPERDKEHIEGDIERAYINLIKEWLFYMKHLKEDYPYLFSLAIRTNPFKLDCKAEIE